MSPSRASVVTLSLALLVRVGALHAQTPAAPVELARAAFQRGVLLAQQEHWYEALGAFRESRRHADRPRTAFNVGLALHRLGQFREARAALRECIAMPGVTAEADLVADANALEAEVGRSLARLRLVVAPPNAEVRVNGDVFADGRDQPIREIDLDPGTRQIEVSSLGLATQRFSIDLRTGDSIQRRVDLAVIPGRVAVSVDQREATVSIDDEVVGHGTTVWQGSPGPHRVRVEADGYRTFRRPVTVVAGGDLRVEVTLASARTPWFQSPWLWGGVGLAVIGGVVAALLIERSAAPDGGSTQQVLQGAMVRW
jgi:hypothetical protein